MRVRIIPRAASVAAALVLLACGSSSDSNNNSDNLSQVPPGSDPSGMQGSLPGGSSSSPNDSAPPATGGDGSQPPPSTGEQPGGEDGQTPTAGTGGTTTPPAVEDPPAMGDDPRGCPALDSGFPGDEACLLPPDPSEGMQIHIGPENYDDPADVNRFIFEPGSESSECWTFHTPNGEEIFYQGWVLSGRPGTHHIINTMYAIELQDGGFSVCQDPGTGTNPNSLGNLPGASKPYMPLEPIAPENEGLGRSVPPNTPSQADMHYFNFTDAPILREFWMNVYFVPPEQVTEQANQIRGMGGFGWNIAPGTDRVYQYSCPIETDGRIIQLLGHYHAHGVRFTAWLNRNTANEVKVFEMYDYLEPAIFNYNSVTENPTFSQSSPGAVSGMLEVSAGDTLDWECHIINDSDVGLTYSNFVETGEMCNLWGAAVGPNINCVIPTFF